MNSEQIKNAPATSQTNRRFKMNSKTQIIRPKALAKQLDISVTTLWRWRLQGVIPQPVVLGSRIIGWDQSTIDDWLQKLKEKIEKSDKKGGGKNE
jgi:prophage regulatory protein